MHMRLLMIGICGDLWNMRLLIFTKKMQAAQEDGILFFKKIYEHKKKKKKTNKYVKCTILYLHIFR